jgi:uncharacterized small protein (DUF1192 family)
MNMKLEVDDDTVDAIIVASLTQSIDLLEMDIKRLKKMKNRKPYQNEDLSIAMLDVDALKRTRHYFGGENFKC